MKLQISKKNLTSSEEKDFDGYLDQKLETLENLVQNYAEDAVILDVNIEKFEKHDAFSVEMKLSIPNGRFLSKEVSHHITKALDLSKDRMLVQLRKHLDQKSDRGHKSIRKEAKVVNVEV